MPNKITEGLFVNHPKKIVICKRVVRYRDETTDIRFICEKLDPHSSLHNEIKELKLIYERIVKSCFRFFLYKLNSP